MKYRENIILLCTTSITEALKNLTTMDKKFFFIIAVIIFCLGSVEQLFGQQKVVQLYNGLPPGSENWNWEEKTFFVKTPLNAHVAYNVTRPTLTVFIPERANGISVLIFPGGALRVLNVETEGSFVAQELIKKGFTVFLLKYRVVQTHTDDPWQEAVNGLKDTSRIRLDEYANVITLARQDAVQAIRYVRAHARDYQVDSSRVGVLGFSAGGSLVQFLSIEAAAVDKPSFSGIISSVNKQMEITSKLPPAFIAGATDDLFAPSTNSIQLYNAWIAGKNSAELHVYKNGGHGLRGFPANSWIQRYMEWMLDMFVQKN